MRDRQTKYDTSATVSRMDRHIGIDLKRRFQILLRFCRLIGENFTRHQCTLRAAALTYTTILSLIPVLAIAFAILKGLGAQNSLEPLLLKLAGDSRETIDRIIGYVNNTNFKSVGAIGVMALVITAISMLENIELAFNAIWGVKETRSPQRRFSDYLSVVVVGPILILVATSVTTTLQNQSLVQWLIQRTTLGGLVLFLFRLAPYLSIWIALVFLYLYIPNTRVRFRSALLGGVLAGTAWQVAQWAYFYFQIGVSGYNAIYGTLAALPIFLVWVYTSWLIVLFGVEVVCAHQRSGYMDILAPGYSGTGRAGQEEQALAVMIQICRHFHEGGKPPVASALANELRLRQDVVVDTLEQLEKAGYLTPTVGSEPGWLPARDPSVIEVCRLLTDLRGSAGANDDSPPALILAGDIIRQEADCCRSALRGVTLRDLSGRENGPLHGPATDARGSIPE